jgi:hypothetical protein
VPKFSDIEIKVSFERLKTSVDALTLEAATNALTLKSSVEALTLKAYTELNELRASFEVGTFGFLPLDRSFTDSLNIASEIFFSFTKQLEDSVDLPSELVSIDVSLNKQNTGIVAENIAIALEKSFFSTFSASEFSNIQTVKVLSNSISFTEDAVALDSQKVLTDSAIFDQSTLFEIEKNIISNIFATDDLDGTASTEDDQEIIFIKQRQDRFIAAEETFLENTKLLANTSTASDDIEFVELIKNLANTGTSEDLVTLLVEKLLENNLSSAEELTFILEKELENSAEVLEAIIKGIAVLITIVVNRVEIAVSRIKGLFDIVQQLYWLTNAITSGDAEGIEKSVKRVKDAQERMAEDGRQIMAKYHKDVQDILGRNIIVNVKVKTEEDEFFKAPGEEGKQSKQTHESVEEQIKKNKKNLFIYSTINHRATQQGPIYAD